MDDIMKCECGLMYVPWVKDNEAYHSEHHDKWVNGQPILSVSYERIIGTIGGKDILESSKDLPLPYRAELAKVALLAQRDMSDYPAGYDGSDEDPEFDSRAYILRERDRGVGIIILRRRDTFWPFTWNNNRENIVPHNAVSDIKRWVVERIWIVSKLRRQNYGKHFIACVAKYLELNVCDFGWELPFTDNGRLLVKSICPEGFLGTGDLALLDLEQK